MNTYRRSLALVLIGWCAALLPADRVSWAAAMEAEVDAIEDEHAALAFVVGCVWGSVKERTLTMGFAVQTVRFATIASMLALALVSACIAGRLADVHAPSALVFGLTSALFAAAGVWSLLRGPLALIRTASIMIPVYIIAYVFVRLAGGIGDRWDNAGLYRALAIEGVVIWATFLAGGIFMLRAGTLSTTKRT